MVGALTTKRKIQERQRNYFADDYMARKVEEDDIQVDQLQLENCRQTAMNRD